MKIGNSFHMPVTWIVWHLFPFSLSASAKSTIRRISCESCWILRSFRLKYRSTSPLCFYSVLKRNWYEFIQSTVFLQTFNPYCSRYAAQNQFENSNSCKISSTHLIRNLKVKLCENQDKYEQICGESYDLISN